jgi:RNA polymerase sigma-70 factor (ECF subfamily)
MGESPTSDAALMARVAAGDRDALAALIDRHKEYVYKLAYRFAGRWDVADDITQDAFLRVYRAAPTYRSTAAFSTWLYRLVLNLCRDWRRAQTYRDHAPLDEGSSVADNATTRVEREEIVQAVRAAIEALADNQREALILHRYGELSHREIAEIMGKSESAVESYLVRAYANLRTSLGGMRALRPQDGAECRES